ncbi:hydroquinone glucosyltransferase-like [Triticum dicoccoides]|uniref:hydroquinone glucosyltransferase-like n=1 Tax=Triticum dicoccoides TaxID=85692 RepID=UPI001891B37B|nr:hydroquinone glucosyltransferase-like [Triticum dicoccoides]
MAQAAHVVMLTSSGAGHVLPVSELAKRLAVRHGFTVTIVTYASLSTPGHSSPLASLPPGVSVAALPEVSISDLPADAHLVTRILTVINRALPQLRDLLRSLLGLPAGITAFMTDMLCPAALAVSKEMGLPGYVFYTSSLMSLLSLLYTPELSRTTTCECRDLPEPVMLPGCVPLHGADLVEPVQNRSDPVYELMVDLGLNYLLAEGFIVNTMDALEHETLVAFQELSDKGVYPPAYAVGPFTRRRCPDSDEVKHSCLRWLDNQPDGSVLYVSFGSGGALSTEQTAELAAGLEASEQRFLWVVHHPNDKDSSAGYLGTATTDDDPLSYLPEGFVERTKGTGLLVPLWAPQVEILNHVAVGGFMSHGGWNSTLESVAAGVPMVAWPLYAEQRMNAVMLSSDRVGLALWERPPLGKDGAIVPREEVAALVRELMEGEKGGMARKKADHLRDEAEIASAPGGSQDRALAVVAGMVSLHRKSHGD